MHTLKLALNKSMRASDNEQGINKLLPKKGENIKQKSMKIKIQEHLTELYMVIFQSTFEIFFFICMIDPTQIYLSPSSL